MTWGDHDLEIDLFNQEHIQHVGLSEVQKGLQANIVVTIYQVIFSLLFTFLPKSHKESELIETVLIFFSSFKYSIDVQKGEPEGNTYSYLLRNIRHLQNKLEA